jgi:hypothetical protein
MLIIYVSGLHNYLLLTRTPKWNTIMLLVNYLMHKGAFLVCHMNKNTNYFCETEV